MKTRLLFILAILAMTCLVLTLFFRKSSPNKKNQPAIQAIYFVSPLGDDHNRGSIDSPFATIWKARNIVRTINRDMTGDILINLRTGLYELDSTFSLTVLDKGRNGHNIIYQAFHSETPVLSGGRKITGWTLHDTSKNIYQSNVGMNVDTRQLYVNGSRAIRARSADATGWRENADGYDCPAAVAGWGNIKNVEVVSYSDWKCHRGPVAVVSGSHAVMAQPYWKLVHGQFNAPPSWVENAYELLDAEGEWYLDKSAGILYYKPRRGEDMKSAEIIMPLLETLVSGSAISNVQFKRMSFAYATWLHPNSVNGYPCGQADLIFTGVNAATLQVPGNIRFSYSHDLRLEGNIFEHLGIAGLELYRGCKNNTVYDNDFHDISGSAVSIGSVADSLASRADLVKDNILDNNFITMAALEYAGSVGVFVGYTEHTVISHNHIRHLPYSGISMGWGWSNTITVAKNNEICYNRIDSVMMILFDGGAIYTIGAQPGTRVHDNYINQQFHEFGSLYPDAGTSYTHWYNNVVQNEIRWLHIWTPSIEHDTVDHNYYDNPTQTVNGTKCIIENNTLVSKGAWPATAVSIMKNSGRKVAVVNMNLRWAKIFFMLLIIISSLSVYVYFFKK